jgi:hypothetical protein
MWEYIEKILTLFGILVTAAATLALWRATKVLAVETKRMAEASAQPQIVVSIEPNQWSMRHADVHVANTGNATAFDIAVDFDPPLVVELENRSEPVATPFQKLSLLKPGQKLTSWIGMLFPLLDHIYTIKISYSRKPGGDREDIQYSLDMSSFKSIHRLGENDPMTQMARNLKNLQEDMRKLISGSKKLDVDVYTSSDRQTARQELEEWMEEQRTRKADGKST